MMAVCTQSVDGSATARRDEGSIERAKAMGSSSKHTIARPRYNTISPAATLGSTGAAGRGRPNGAMMIGPMPGEAGIKVLRCC
mmetsp:Transcript_3798/g.10686  ORF Transcript_3798/g.10686 Transcript_3798/m.10686 type:complete len:83 (+) Transcript_3798:881-1129(+)